MVDDRSAPTLAVLYVGRGEQAEFRTSCRLLAGSAALVRVETLEEAHHLLRSGPFAPELIVVEQLRPGEPQAIQALRDAAPLSGIWVLSASWADGEERTGRPSPLAERIEWSSFGVRWAQELRRASSRRPATWQAPPTSTGEERFLARQPSQPASHGPLVAVYSDHRAVCQWLSDLLSACGAVPLASGLAAPARAPSAQLAVVDFDELRPGWSRAWRTIERATPAARRIVLLDFPRWHDAEEAQSHGVHAVYAKPLTPGTLEGELALDRQSRG